MTDRTDDMTKIEASVRCVGQAGEDTAPAGNSSRMFHHIYVEEAAYDYPLTQRILRRLGGRRVISIHHYKDIFNRRNQDFAAQKAEPALILAVKEGNLIYKGAPVCQSFGEEHFFYTSCMMNCVYDCEYCYLQGMYPSGNVVVFVNQDSIFEETDRLLAEHPVYLCISYDTDLLALEPLLGIVHRWADFAAERQGLTIELRTKSAGFDIISDIKANDRFILAWTLSPDSVSTRFEHRTPSANARIESAARAMAAGFPVRLCFDPMIYTRDWEERYCELVSLVADKLDLSLVRDASVGVFRISSEYLGIMRKQRPCSEVVNYPYRTAAGVASLSPKLNKKMITYMCKQLSQYIPTEKIYCVEET